MSLSPLLRTIRNGATLREMIGVAILVLSALALVVGSSILFAGSRTSRPAATQ